MRKIALAIAGSLIFLGVPAATTVVTAAPAMATCSHTYDWDAFVGTGLGPGYFQSDWESGNCSPTEDLQTRVQCHPSAGGNEYYEYSGIVSGSEIEDAATCLFAGIADHGWTRFRAVGGTWGDWESNWTRCCTRPKGQMHYHAQMHYHG